MHTTEAGERRKALKRYAKEMARKALTLREAAKILPELKLEAMEKAKALKVTAMMTQASRRGSVSQIGD